jgi:pimeloyl-ACP methyl ester carboxylesterase
MWQFQVDHFGTNAALALDLPGHGQRADYLPPEVHVADYARVVHAILFQELGLQAPILAGHSLGGAIALTMALQYQGQVAGLILIGTGARLRVRPDLLEAARTTSLQAILPLKELAWVKEPTGPELNNFYRDLAACDAFDLMEHLHEIDLPTLIICGEEDRMTPLKYSQYLHEHLKGSMLRSIAGAGHYVMREQPQQVNQAIEEWLCRQK